MRPIARSHPAIAATAAIAAPLTHDKPGSWPMGIRSSYVTDSQLYCVHSCPHPHPRPRPCPPPTHPHVRLARSGIQAPLSPSPHRLRPWVLSTPRLCLEALFAFASCTPARQPPRLLLLLIFHVSQSPTLLLSQSPSRPNGPEAKAAEGGGGPEAQKQRGAGT